jgi:hypothetical protein
MKKSQLWIWRFLIGICALLLFPLSVWYIWSFGIVSSSWDPKFPPNALPLPFLPDFLGAVVGLLLMTWGIVALWWLVFHHGRRSIREIAATWWVGLTGGTSMAVYWLCKFSASNGQNDEYVIVSPLVFLLAFEVLLLVRISLNRPRCGDPAKTEATVVRLVK